MIKCNNCDNCVNVLINNGEASPSVRWNFTVQ